MELRESLLEIDRSLTALCHAVHGAIWQKPVFPPLPRYYMEVLSRSVDDLELSVSTAP
jgi:hypothetical protein